PFRAQQIGQAIVAFVAGILVDLRTVLEARDRDDGTPRPRECFRILDRDRVFHEVGTDAPETLDDFQLVRGAHVDTRPLVVRTVEEALRLDDERIPLPMADRVAKPLRHVAMRATVERNDAPVAKLLMQDRYKPRTLHDAVVPAVWAAPHQRGYAVGQATLARIGVEI